MGYNVERNTIGTVPNSPLVSDTGKEIHPPILSTLAIHGGQVKREITIVKHKFSFLHHKIPVPNDPPRMDMTYYINRKILLIMDNAVHRIT